MNDINKDNYNSKVLVDMWGDFIDWDKRRAGEEGFLLEQLKNCQKIFDACLGDGADSIHLLQNGFDVTSNDLDETFIRKAQANAEKNNVKLKITQHDWRDLDEHFENNIFEAVICLGNSLTYLFKKDEQLKTLKNFLAILKTDGALIIDERNYQYILDNREEILHHEQFEYTGRYVYCGNKVHGKPIEISDEKVKMEYTDDTSDKKGYLVLYPFKQGELLNLLKEAKFADIKQYSDYQEGFNPRADFYQYVCKK